MKDAATALSKGEQKMLDAAAKDFLKNFEEVIGEKEDPTTGLLLPSDKNMQLHQFDELLPAPPSVSVKQDNVAYVNSRQLERPLVTAFLFEALCKFGARTIYRGRGRPPVPLRDKLFLVIEKVHRRETYDSLYEIVMNACRDGYIQKKLNLHSIPRFMQDPQLTPLFEALVTFTATPLAGFEKEFAVDSTGIGKFGSRWVKESFNKKKKKKRQSKEQEEKERKKEQKKRRQYRKEHTLVGARTGIIVSALVTIGSAHDSPPFKLLLEQAKRYFIIKEVSGDAAYCSKENAQLVEDAGGVPYFDLKKNLKMQVFGARAWSRMLKRFLQNARLYWQHYNKRSNVESVYSSFKRKIASIVLSKSSVAQENEALCIAIVHNLRTLVRAHFMLGIDPLQLKR